MPTASSSYELSSLHTLRKIISKTREGCPRSDLLKEAIRDLAALVRAQNTSLFEVESDDPELMVLVATVNKSDTAKKRLVLPTKTAPGKGITPWCASQKAPGKLDKKGLEDHAEYRSPSPPGHLGQHTVYSLLWVPLLDEKGRLIGLLKCENKLGADGKPGGKGSFTEADLQLAQHFQQVLMLALLCPYPLSPEQIEARKIVRQIALRQLNENSNPEHLFQIILSAAVRILKGQRGDLAWWMGRERDLVYAAVENGAPDCPDIMPGRVLPDDSFMRAVFDCSRHDHDVASHVHTRTKNYAMADKNVRSELAVRIDLHGNPVGVINVESYQEDFFKDGHLDALRDIAQAAAIAVQQSQFNQLLQRAMVEKDSQPEQILQPILEGILESLGYDAGLIYRYEFESESRWLRVAAYAAASDISADPAEFKHMLDKPSFAKRVFELQGEGGLSCLRPHEEKDVDHAALREWKIKSPLFGFPLEFEGTPVGCIVLWTIQRQSPRHNTADHIIRVFQQLVAARIAQWNKNAELLQKKNFFDVLSRPGSSFMVFTKREEAWGREEKLPHEKCQREHKLVFEWANDEFKRHVGDDILKKSGHLGRLEGSTDWDIFPHEALAYYTDDLSTLNGTSVDGKFERHVRPRDGAVMQVLVWKASFTGADKKRRILVFFWDRTETRRIEMENELWSDDFFHRVSSCLSQVSHALHEQPRQAGGPPSVPPVASSVLNKVRQGLEHTQALAHLLYEWKKGDAMEMKAYCREVVQTVSKVYEPSLAGSPVKLTDDYCAAIFLWPKARASVRILVELVSNAYLHAWKDGGTGADRKIHCSLQEAAGGHILTVSDNGAPSHPDLAHLDDTRGLGIVMRLSTDSLGGPGTEYTAAFHDGTAPGNTYRTFLPAVQQAALLRQPQPEGGRAPRILFVDDEIEEAEHYIAALRAEKYHVVGPVMTKKEALNTLAAENFALIVLDISLNANPKGGIEIAMHIRSQLKPGAIVPIIFLTQHGAGHQLIEEAKQIPGTSIMVKHANRVVDDLILEVFCRLRDRAMGDRNLFICYSGKNRKFMHLLKDQMKAHGIGQDLDIKAWSDQDIKAGDHWFDEICKALHSSVAAVFLVDADFINCEFIQRKELPLLLNTLKIQGKTIFPIFVSATGTRLESGFDLETLQFMADTKNAPLEGLSKAKLNAKLCKIARQIREDLSWYLGKPPDYPGAP